MIVGDIAIMRKLFSKIFIKRTLDKVFRIFIVLIPFALIGHEIDDFYYYVNESWMDSIELKGNLVVVNNWGILWDDISAKSLEILDNKNSYNLDKHHLYTLYQIRNFYTSIPPDKNKLSLVQEYFPIYFGILFSTITISEEKNEQINHLLNYLRTAYKDKILNSDELSNFYRNLFIKKLDNMELIIGSPPLSSMTEIPELSDTAFEENIRIINELDFKEPCQWESPPYETDCRYNYHQNLIKIYSGILFDKKFKNQIDVVYKFATLGRTIAHEMTHAFDEVGKNYDENGDHIGFLSKLFSRSKEESNFWQKTHQSLVKQYNQYTIQDSLFIDGEKTVQENFADIGGLEISLYALKIFMKEAQYSNDDEKKALREFFIYYAQFWREKSTSEFEVSTLKRNHTPQKYRAIGPIYNQCDFYEVFDINEESEFFINVEDRIKIW